jgi:tetratricopeptide (TPR) repeat protein
MRQWLHRAAAALSFVVPLAMYVKTHTPTVPFWDSGEFIAVSAVLGIPHPPGMPFYVLLGRVALLPGLAPPAATLNVLAGIAAAVTCLFIYLITVRLAHGISDGRWADPSSRAPLFRGAPPAFAIPLIGLGAAFVAAFSYTFWFNAIEAEVYSLAGMISALGIWAALLWRDRADDPGVSRVLLLVAYLVALAVGIHLSVALIVPGIFLFVLLVRPRTLGSAKLWTWALALAVLGVSVHLYLFIRAHHHPAINEADPSTLHRLWLMLSRDQYKPPTPFVRRAALGYQFDEMFWQYLRAQYVAGGRGILGVALGSLPFLAALAGAVLHWRRDRKGFWLMATTLFLTSIYLVFYLNFTDHEVRARDYFFFLAFQFLPIWFALGLFALAREAAARLPSRGSLGRAATGGVCLLGIVYAFSMAVHGMPAHDRSGYYFARDLAHNLLTGLPKNTILFTNGDNDTFPLWYAQFVENERQDIRIVNLSLLNTPWYMKQARDGHPQPAVPVNMSDVEIDALRPTFDRGGRPLGVADQGVYAILTANNWKRPVYAAMTVPESYWSRLGFSGRLKVEGVNLKIEPARVSPSCDAHLTVDLLDHTYQYRGILTPEGKRSARLAVDPETEGLVQNYGASYYAAGRAFVETDSLEAAAHAFKRATIFAPDVAVVHQELAAMYLETFRLAQAEEVIGSAMMRWPRLPELYKLRGDLFGLREDLDGAAESYRKAIELNRDFRAPYVLLYHIYVKQGRPADAGKIIEDFLAGHPQDAGAKDLLAKLDGVSVDTLHPSR